VQAQSARLGRERINAFSADKISASHKSCKGRKVGRSKLELSAIDLACMGLSFSMAQP